MWEEVARRVLKLGGAIHLQHRVVGIACAGDRVVSVDVLDAATGGMRRVTCDHFISTIPVKDLMAMLKPEQTSIARIAADLPYRDFMTAGLLLRGMRERATPPDNWIYIQEPDVRIGRLQIFNEGDDLWAMEDDQFLRFAIGELETIGLIAGKDVIDGTLVRVPRAYPAYFGTYSQFGTLRHYLDRFSNLYPIGRNGMHRYNNQDHSMLTANAAVDAITRQAPKAGIWTINIDGSYHEETVDADIAPAASPRS
jgi:protoporphyrinogen oxidase